MKNLGKSELHLALTCSTGFEGLIVDELAGFGGNQVVAGTGIVTANGSLETAYRSCLWSRFASRVLVEIATFAIVDDNDLYNRCCQVAWPALFPLKSSFAVTCTLGKNAVIQHSQYASLRVKDAIVDTFRAEQQERPSVRTQQPDIQFHLHIEGNSAGLYLDFSGESLHRRGYRDESVIAPLKETLGAAIVALSGWKNSFGDVLDPMCGSGTLLIEAAMMFGDVAPGLSRKYYGFFGWTGHDEKLWQKLVTEAIEREDAGLEKEWPKFRGFDNDPEAVRAAIKNIARAGLEKNIHVELRDIAFLPAEHAALGMVICNLPYGERLSEKDVVFYLYRCVGRILRERYAGWQAALFISEPKHTDSFSLNFSHKYKLMNGPVACRLLVGDIEPAPDKFVWELQSSEHALKADDFANRLKKNLKTLGKWADKSQIECYRIYDRDLPDYNIAVDIYGKWLHIQEYAPPKSVAEEVAKERFTAAVEAIKEILGVRSNRIFYKRRQRQRGRDQYTKQDSSGKFYEVREGICSFLVNFTDYLDTGLFLDHRPVRQRIGVESANKRFLNLFGYTGTATVHAALGGAASTTTVDLSQRYLQWARCNLALNGLGEKRNRLISKDVFEWLRADDGFYDIIFVDPPTFSNTKKENRVFDVQRDHTQLIELAAARLAKEGVLLFSTNSRKFSLAETVTRKYRVNDITADSIPVDFSRNSRIHKCWEIYR